MAGSGISFVLPRKGFSSCVVLVAALLEKLHAFNKACFLKQHDDFDRVEVTLAGEASRQIRLAVHSGIKFTAGWTQKAIYSFIHFRWDRQNPANDPFYRQFISQQMEFCLRKSSLHTNSVRLLLPRNLVSAASPLRRHLQCQDRSSQ